MTGESRERSRAEELHVARPSRDALYGELVDHLSAVGDIHLLLARGEHLTARRLAGAFREETRLLDDLGWASDDARESYPLTMDAQELASVLGRLHRDASALLASLLARPREDEALSERSLAATGACGALLSQIAERTGEGPWERTQSPRRAR